MVAVFDVSARKLSPLAVAIVVVLSSLLPAPGGSAAGGLLGSTVLGLGTDAWLHAAGYAVLAVTAARATRPASRAAWLALWLSLVAFGVGVEGLQALVPTRTPALADAVTNAAGAAVGLALAWRW